MAKFDYLKPQSLDEARSLVITIEEAHKFLNPEVADKTIFGTIAREMRKYNVSLLVIDQRPSGINEEVMSQLGTKITCLLDNERDIDAVLAGVAGVLITPIISMSFDRGTMLGLKGFSAAILGGIGHPVGGVICGLVLGTLEQCSAWFSSVYKETLALGFVVGILLFRPKGLFSK
jgi:hypothetical protein